MKTSKITLLGLATLLGTIILFPTPSSAATEREDPIGEATEVIQENPTITVPPEVQELVDNFTDNKIVDTNSMVRASKKASFYRGTILMWARDNINFNHSGGKVTSSNGLQEAGYILPNIVRKKGIKSISKTSATHKWYGMKTIGAGTPTPWGDVTIYNYDYTDYYGVHGDGSATWY